MSPLNRLKLKRNRIRLKALLQFAQETFPGKNIPDDILKKDLIKILTDIFSTSGPQPVSETRSQVQPEPESTQTQALHPFIIELSRIEKQIDVVNAIRNRFKNHPINGILPIPDLIRLAEKLLQEEAAGGAADQPTTDKIPAEKTTEPENPKPFETAEPESQIDSAGADTQEPQRAWDDSGPIQREQLFEIVRLKKALGITSQDSWNRMVGFFYDQDNNPVKTATALTKVA